MCSQGDHPPYDPPTPTRPRTLVYSGDRPEEAEARGDYHVLHVDSAMTIGCSCGVYDDDYAVMTQHIRGLGDEYKEATDAAMNYGDGYRNGVQAGRTIALAILGDMLNSAEDALLKAPDERRDVAETRLLVLRSARDRLAEARQ